MKYLFLYLSVLLLLLCCKPQREYLTIGGYTFEPFDAPGVKKVAINFYADVAEVANIEYRYFMSWRYIVYGKNSKEFKEVYPDTSVWIYQNYADSLQSKYLQQRERAFYPVVGVTLKQAKLFSDWRTERVAEHLLVREGLIRPNKNLNRDNFFTIEKYLEGNYEGAIKIKPVLVLPRYTVPTIEEWEFMAGLTSNLKYGLDIRNKHNRQLVKRYQCIIQSKECLDLKNKNRKKHEKYPFPTEPVRYGYQNIFGLFNAIGNVAELVDSAGVAKGGDWYHYLEGADLKQNIKTNIPNCWTGFRNVCRLEVVKRKAGN